MDVWFCLCVDQASHGIRWMTFPSTFSFSILRVQFWGLATWMWRVVIFPQFTHSTSNVRSNGVQHCAMDGVLRHKGGGSYKSRVFLHFPTPPLYPWTRFVVYGFSFLVHHRLCFLSSSGTVRGFEPDEFIRSLGCAQVGKEHRRRTSTNGRRHATHHHTCTRRNTFACDCGSHRSDRKVVGETLEEDTWENARFPCRRTDPKDDRVLHVHKWCTKSWQRHLHSPHWEQSALQREEHW